MAKGQQREHQSVLADLIDGAIAGLVATWAMGKATSYLYEHEDKAAREREDEARGGKTAYGVAAEKAARVAGKELSQDERQRYGEDIHWALGIGTGALYGLLRDRMHQARLARGLAFGAAFWLAVDEGAIYALRLTPGPTAFPWQAHARGLAGHVVYGTVADATLAALQPSA